MAAKAPRNPGLHVTVVLFVCWTNLHFSLSLKNDPRSQFYSHAVIQPVIYTEARGKRDLDSVKEQNAEKMSVSFLAFDKEFILDLSINKFLLPSHYFEKHHVNGSHVIRSPMKENSSHCHYQGEIRGVNNSLVAISTCNGVSGIINDGDDMYYIHPDDRTDNNSHFLFRAQDLKPHNLTCGMSDSSNFLVNSQLFDSPKRNKRSAVLQEPYKNNQKSRYVELIIVNDNKEECLSPCPKCTISSVLSTALKSDERFKEFKQDQNAVFERSKQIANIVNALYSPLNIYIALVGVLIWSENDEIKLSTDGDATLTNFLHYRKERLAREHPNDNAQLITAMTFDGGVVGKALKGPICTYEYSGGVNMDHSLVVGLVASTVAHELGHNFGMEHDNDECQCPDEKCIMAPSSSSTSPRHWSSCSLEYLDLAFSQGMDYCLKNYPVHIVGPVCGNGFLEEGEDCDCGLKEFCDNQCCNATSCQLFSNATCGMGECCDMETCQIKKVATLCRDTKSECDLPEYCDGVSEHCPIDSFHQDGKDCNHGRAYCYDGHCQSHLDQCKLLWGQTGKIADLRCFEQNYRGNVNGNCGYDRIKKSYKACRKEDIMCGMLHCTHLNERLEFGMESAAILARSYINVKGKTFTCRSAIVDLGLFNRDPGLAPNGAKCGEGKVCVNQKCVPVSSIRNRDCLYSCNENGVCNNKGNCHCNKGYGPPYCSSEGPGGSIDSGPASDPNNYLIMIALYILFFGLLPLMLLSVSLIYYFRNHLKVWWSKKAHKADIKTKPNTTPQKKAQLQTKFSIDKNSLRMLEISGPIPIPSPGSNAFDFAALTFPYRMPNCVLNQSNVCQGVVSPCISNVSENLNCEKKNLVPLRSAPMRPNNVPQRTPSWASPTVVVSSTVARTSSLRSPCDKGVSYKPITSTSFRPSCPPPRPPPSKTESVVKHNPSSSYEDINKTIDEGERSVTPCDMYYDDCQTLELNGAALSSARKQTNNKRNNSNEIIHKSSFSDHLKHKGLLNKSDHRITSIKNQKPTNKMVIPQAARTVENSVAALAKKFEKQENHQKKNFSPDTSMRPPFKSRPLPPRPGDTDV